MQNARKLVSIAESIPYDVELCYGRYVVNAKSMLGVLSMPEFDEGELHIHTDNEKECEKILFQLLDQNLIVDTGDAVKRSIYDITTFGEILIDFTSQDINEDGQMLYARNPGGAPANVAVAASRLGAHTAFIGKAGKDMHGKLLKSVLEKEGFRAVFYMISMPCSAHSFRLKSFSLNFWIFPLPVMGNSFTKKMYLGIL